MIADYSACANLSRDRSDFPRGSAASLGELLRGYKLGYVHFASADFARLPTGAKRGMMALYFSSNALFFFIYV